MFDENNIHLTVIFMCHFTIHVCILYQRLQLLNHQRDPCSLIKRTDPFVLSMDKWRLNFQIRSSFDYCFIRPDSLMMSFEIQYSFLRIEVDLWSVPLNFH